MSLMRITLNIEGMSCASCAMTIEKALKKLSGIQTAVVNLLTETAVVEGIRLDADTLIQAVKNAGYNASLNSIDNVMQNTQESVKVYQINGMSCAACAMNVEKALKKVPGVKSAYVNIATKKATLTIDPSTFSERLMAKAVSNAGYELVINQKEPSFELNDKESKLKQAKSKMIWAWAITGPLAVLMITDMTNLLKIPYFGLISIIAAFFVIFVIGITPIKSGLKAIIHKSANMDVLIFLGVMASYLAGILSFFGMHIANYAAIGAMIMGFYLIGQYLEALAKGKASDAIKKLITMNAKIANLITEDGIITMVEAKDLIVGDIVLVKPSQQIPADGIIIEGESVIDESMVTGEFLPKMRGIGDKVIGSCINQTGAIKIRVTAVGQDTFLSQMVKLIEQAMSTKVPIQSFADKVVSIFVPAVLVIAILTFLFWAVDPIAAHSISTFASLFLPWVNPHLNTLSAAIFASVATLVVACPCALGLATPTALMVSSGLGAANGILIRSGEALQNAKDIDTVVFDKTGTITTGKISVSSIYSKIDENDFLVLAASLENYSEHPLAKSLVEYSKTKGIILEAARDIETQAGLGIKGVVNGKKIIIGNINYIKTFNLDLPEDIQSKMNQNETLSIVFGQSEGFLGYITFKDPIKESAKQAINALKEMKIKTVMLTGDNEMTAKAIAQLVDIDEVYYNLLPHQKLEQIRNFQQNHIVAMVGDGINDAPALKQANIGIAIGTGTDITKEASDITLIGSDLEGVVKAIKLSKAKFKKIRQNLFWAFFYNIIAIPVAALGLLHPAIAEAAMAASSVNVVTNSLRLKKYKF